MIPDVPTIGIYQRHTWVTSVSFNHRWQATLFHFLVNRSIEHLGSRDA